MLRLTHRSPTRMWLECKLKEEVGDYRTDNGAMRLKCVRLENPVFTQATIEIGFQF